MLVSNTILREEFERRRKRGTMTAYKLAQLVGWTCPATHEGRPITRPDDSRVRNALGLKLYNPGRGYPPRKRTRISDKNAIILMNALQLDPVEVGL